MRKWVLLAAVGVALFLTLAIVALVRLRGFLAENRDRLVARASAALGREVGFEDVGVSLWRGPGISARAVRIADDPRFSDGVFVAADRVRVTMRLLPALVGRYEIAAIDVDAPELTVIRDGNGFNFASLDRSSSHGETAAEPGAPVERRRRATLGSPALRLHGARVRYVDRRSTPASETTLDQLDVTARDRDPSPGLDVDASFELRAFRGTVRGEASYEDRSEPPAFALCAEARGIALGAGTDAGSERRPVLEGRLGAEIDVRGSGRDAETIQRGLLGSGRFAVEEGALRNLNIAESVLSGLTGVGGLSGLASPRFRERHPKLFGAADTPFEELGGSLAIEGGRMTTDDLALRTSDYAVRAAGRLDFSGRVELKARWIASRELSDDLTAEAKETRYLANDDGLLEIPLRVRGKLPDLRIEPKPNHVARALRRALEDKGFGDLLGGSGRTPGAKDDLEEMIEKGLEKLFR